MHVGAFTRTEVTVGASQSATCIRTEVWCARSPHSPPAAAKGIADLLFSHLLGQLQLALHKVARNSSIVPFAEPVLPPSQPWLALHSRDKRLRL